MPLILLTVILPLLLSLLLTFTTTTTNLAVVAQEDNNDGNSINEPFVVQLPSTASGIEIPSYSHGFSLEMSHWTTVFGTRSDKQSAGFLQLLRNIEDRRGALMIRLGGNSQDAASSDESISAPIAKTGEQATRTNSGATTYNIKVHSKLFDAMRRLSNIVAIKWTVGLNFENAGDMESALSLGKVAVDKLGDLLYAVQIGNEPDLYAKHGLRSDGWGVQDYTGEWVAWATQLSQHFYNNDDNQRQRNIFSGGVICCTWHLQDLLDSGYFERSKELINSITVQKYSSNACFGVAKGEIDDYLSHAWITSLPRKMYQEQAQVITGSGKELVMGETNTAACGGIQGISDTFVSALWWVDWQLFLYSISFSSVELQLGGPKAHYNPMSKIGSSWTANPIYYGSLVTAEALGPSDTAAQVVHIDLPSDSQAAYAIFHKQQFTYAVLINFDPDNEAVFPLQPQQEGWIPVDDSDGIAKLKVKRLTATSLQERHAIQWAGQTLHNVSDGRLRGDVAIEEVICSAPDRCEVTLPKSSVALVGRHLDYFNGTAVTDDPYDVSGLVGSNGDNNKPVSSNPLAFTSATSSKVAIAIGYLLPLMLVAPVFFLHHVLITIFL
ncbi:hypothetical protein BDB00DRAFT_59807 [Zychaea mexicana]|uniref:uncharacterized protein n=1 Tax=Zychaea mexicana TaxID=64656 RepID=UPI0022FF020A|nr:uncharacterized protein BDB00DRAFT_59807 [Zychaea mexicana]KAI9488262.1 hypothetical protein BDB00DRAFT_59807 [Zychaea mexicana]